MAPATVLVLEFCSICNLTYKDPEGLSKQREGAISLHQRHADTPATPTWSAIIGSTILEKAGNMRVACAIQLHNERWCVKFCFGASQCRESSLQESLRHNGTTLMNIQFASVCSQRRRVQSEMFLVL